MDKAVQSIPVTVYMDTTLATWPSGCTRHINCNFSKVADQSVSLSAGGNNCVNWAQGDVWENGFAPEGVEATQTVKINTDKGFLWISPASYDALVTACNDCCIDIT